jgi:hypothetical protein
MLCVLFYFDLLFGIHTCVLHLLICAATKWKKIRQNCVRNLKSAGKTRTEIEKIVVINCVL